MNPSQTKLFTWLVLALAVAVLIWTGLVFTDRAPAVDLLAAVKSAAGSLFGLLLLAVGHAVGKGGSDTKPDAEPPAPKQ